MAKKSSIEKNKRRSALVKQYAAKRERLLGGRQRRGAVDGGALRGAPQAGGAAAQLRNPTRIRNRCEMTGRPRAYYRKLGMSRIALRELGSKGLIPGLVKSSW